MSESDNERHDEQAAAAEEESQRFRRPEKRKPSKLRFGDLIGERDTFETVDGKEIEFKHPREFDAVDSAKMERMQQDLNDAIDRLGKDPADEEAATEVDDITEKALLFLLPDLDEKTLSRLKTGSRIQIIEWWAEQTRFFAKGTPSGEAKAGALGN